MKLFSVAASQGMPVYQINQQNAATVIPRLALSPFAMGEINAAVAAGKEVTAHASNLTVGGWTGAGYAIVDPITGDGQYRISDGMNGGRTDHNISVWIGSVLNQIFQMISGTAYAGELTVVYKSYEDCMLVNISLIFPLLLILGLFAQIALMRGAFIVALLAVVLAISAFALVAYSCQQNQRQKR